MAPRIIAHRGGAGLRPENSMAAIENAIRLGVDGIEIDVHLSKDGGVVVYHDYRLNRYLTRSGGTWLPETGPAIKTLSLAELEAYDIGRFDPNSPFAEKYPGQVPRDGEPIPLLKQVVERLLRADARRMSLFVELKTTAGLPELSSDPIALADACVEICEAAEIIDRTRIISFDWRGLQRVRQINPAIETIYLTGTRDFTDEHADEITAGFNPVKYGNSVVRAIAAAGGHAWGPHFESISTNDIAETHDAGLKMSVWTVNDVNDLRKMAYMGVDFVTTDRPDLALTVYS